VLPGGVDGVPFDPNYPFLTTGTQTTLSGGTEILMGTAFGTMLDSGAIMIVSNGGVADGATVNGGAILVVSSGGQAGNEFGDTSLYGTTVSSGVELVVSSGGELVVSSGGTDFAATVAGVEVVVGGGTANQDTVVAGGYEVVQSGGVAQNVTLASGTLEVASGGSVNEVGFQGGSLVLDASANFHGLVAGFGASDQIDLRDVGFVTATTKRGQQSYLSFTEAASNLSGALTVNDGALTANIQLLGQYMASEFTAASDGNGGTLITFTSATLTTGGHGHGNAIASPVTP